MPFTFESKIKIDVKNRISVYPQSVIKNEPMLHRCDLATASKLGGPITREFLSKLPSKITDLPDFIVDSRVHMLMPGWWPCIPGYHHDDIERGCDGQPNYDYVRYEPQHVMCLANGDLAPTEFAIGHSEFPDVPKGQNCYGAWHPEVVRQIETGELIHYKAPSGVPIYFNCYTWHQGVQAVGTGFRWFVRASWNTERHPLNELRMNANVYLESPFAGW